jgi:hypothetical protein
MGAIGVASKATRDNPDLQWLEVPRLGTNRKRLRAFAEALEANTATDVTYVGLVGGVDPMSFRLRVAQSYLRDDLSPSKWSHVFIVAASVFDADPPIVETSLDPAKGFGPYNMPASNNCIQYTTLARYDNVARFPNVALLQLPCLPEEVLARVDELSRQRGAFDVSVSVLKWLAFLWGADSAPNPIVSSVGIPSAAVLETAFAAAGFDLTPGLENRASCPEAIWQAARWWHDFYSGRNQKVAGRYFAKHELVTAKWLRPTAGFVTARKTKADYSAGRQLTAESAPPAPDAQGTSGKR